MKHLWTLSVEGGRRSFSTSRLREAPELYKSTLGSALAALLVSVPAWGGELDTLRDEAERLIKQFASELKGELVSAMKTGGPLNAIGVCSIKAPQIADNISQASDWTVGRSSHKLRNLANEPDDYTAVAIAEFLKRQANGEKPDTMIKAETREESGERIFRMVKAIPTGEVCLACHGGESVKGEVEAAIKEYYPSDSARGFKIGEMRGVFTLKRVLD